MSNTFAAALSVARTEALSIAERFSKHAAEHQTFFNQLFLSSLTSSNYNFTVYSQFQLNIHH
jgi:hypothetical protein